MGAARWLQRGVFCARLVLSVIAPALLVGGCASQKEYLSIALTPGANSPEVQALAQRAHSGDKQAQFELAIRYEVGDGLLPNPKLAPRLYRAAAATTGGTIFVYVPATRKGGRGYTMPVNTGPVEAKVRGRCRGDT